MRRLLIKITGGMLAIMLIAYMAFWISPWPSVLIIRQAFSKGAEANMRAMSPYVPQNISSILNEQYIQGDDDAFLDVYYPADTSSPLPVIVWVHGGAWISGSKDEVADYLKILAAQGYAVVGVDYSVAPKHKYPTPVIQTNAALGYLYKNADRLKVDTTRIVLAGDSGGAHIAAQVASIITSSAYAAAMNIAPAVLPEHLRGVILYCGAYDLELVDFDGDNSWFLNTVLWSYTGTKKFQNNSDLTLASVVNFLTESFPPVFISAGNKDPLEGQSRAFATKAAARGIMVDSVFYGKDYTPGLNHEYQFDLGKAEAQEVLRASYVFLSRVTAENSPSDEI